MLLSGDFGVWYSDDHSLAASLASTGRPSGNAKQREVRQGREFLFSQLLHKRTRSAGQKSTQKERVGSKDRRRLRLEQRPRSALVPKHPRPKLLCLSVIIGGLPWLSKNVAPFRSVRPSSLTGLAWVVLFTS